MYSDGGGKTTAALNPIVGADRVARFFVGLEKKGSLKALRAEFVTVNGQPGALLFSGDRLESILNLALDEHQKVVDIFLIVNPDKLPKA
jgi:RNA polymerase sigma-70 factor (ECF subfamily)